MPFPNNPLTLSGSCTCNAIQYQISIPSLSSRPVQPANPNNKHLFNLPLCALASTHSDPSSILLTPTSLVTISLPPSSSPPHAFLPLQELPTPLIPIRKLSRCFQPATQVLASSKCRSLSFQPLNYGKSRVTCSRCGTHLLSTAIRQAPLFEISISTLKTEGTQQEWLLPERGVYWDAGTLRLISVEHAEKSFVFKNYHEKESQVQVSVCE